MKKLASLLLALTMLVILSTTALGAWYDEAVSYVVENGLIDSIDDPNADGGDATVIDLPQIGLYGNSHFMFQELNNKEIADHIQGWLEARGL